MTNHLNDELKGRIIGLFESGWKIRQISKHLQVPRSTTGDIIKKYKDLGTTRRIEGSGRKPKLLYDQSQSIVEYVESNPKTSAG